MLQLASSCVGLLILAMAVQTSRARRFAPSLPPPSTEAVSVTILLPVRDEAGNVGPCIESLLRQHPKIRIKVIDDNSSDDTATIVQAFLKRFPEIELISAGALPDGWRGKVHALHVGLSGVTDEWVLMTDADTRHGPDLLLRALGAARERQLDVVSVAGFQETRGLVLLR
jgi:cellulose synthase/poly-beta-1,6-N-acetylglucosamine synthase-like glycosyltransferase